MPTPARARLFKRGVPSPPAPTTVTLPFVNLLWSQPFTKACLEYLSVSLLIARTSCFLLGKKACVHCGHLNCSGIWFEAQGIIRQTKSLVLHHARKIQNAWRILSGSRIV